MKNSSSNFPSTPSMLLALSVLVLFFSVASSPLLGTLSAEAALLLGAILGPLSFVAGATRGAHRHNGGFASDVAKEAAWVFGAFLFFIVAAWFNSWRFESCTEDKGLFPFVVLTLPVLFLNLVSGLWIGRLIGRIHLATIVSLMLIALYLLCQVMWWWLFPSLRFFNQYFVVVAGDLLEGQGLSPAIMAYRLSTFLFAISLYILGVLVFKSSQQRRTLSSSLPQTWFLSTALLVALAAIVIQSVSSNELAPSRADLEDQYNLKKRRGTLVLHADPTAINQDDADAILAEGTLWLERLTRRTGIKPKKDIHIWLHANIETQSSYTGAKHVHFTLPKHREIHISGVSIPHPTLGHELAHVLIGEVSTTALGIPGIWGFLPNHGLNEGLAVMLTPELAVRDDLTLKEQAAAIYRLGYETDFESLFAVEPWSFWLKPSSRAYVSAGAFLAALVAAKTKTVPERHAFIRLMAQEGELYAIWTNDDDRSQFIKNYSENLKSLALPDDALGSAARRFKAPAIAYAQCDSKQVELDNELRAAAMQRNYRRCEQLVAKVKANRADTYARVGQIALDLGDRQQALMFLQKALAAKDITDQRLRSELIEKNGDIQWLEGRHDLALKQYRDLPLASLPLPHQRQILAKIAFTESLLNRGEAAYFADAGWRLLSMESDDAQTLAARYADLAFALPTTKSYVKANNPAFVIANYIFSRGQVLGHNYDSGLYELMLLVESPLLPAEFGVEANRLMALAYAMKRETKAALEVFADLRDNSTRPAYRIVFIDLAERTQKIEAALLIEKNSPESGDRWLLGTTKIVE